MLNPAQIDLFLAVIDTGSFHGAAQRVGVSQSTVSVGLKRLEAELGSVLIVRRRDGCIPSRKGEIFLPFARELASLNSRALARLKADRTRIGASSNVGIYLLQPYIRRLVDAGLPQPDLVIAPNPEIAAKLDKREIDLALMEWWDDRPGYVAERWRMDRLVVIVPPGHAWAKRGSIHLETMFSEPFLAGEKGTGTATLLRQALGPAADRLRVSCELGSTEAVKRAVVAGLGVSIVLHGAVAEDLAAGRLCAVAVDGLVLEKTIWCAFPREFTARAGEADLAFKLLELGRDVKAIDGTGPAA
jgi:DNA-binding transcriptional LysR family regulator